MMAAAAEREYGRPEGDGGEGLDHAWRGVTRSGGAPDDVRRLLRKMLQELCEDTAADMALSWARRVGSEHRPLEHWRQRFRDHGIRSIQDFLG